MDDPVLTEPAETGGEPAEERRYSIWSWALPTLAIVGVMALVAIALLRGPTTFDATTPEGAVQEYLQAISRADWEAAFAILDPETFERCEPSDIAAAGQQTFTAAHESTEELGANTLVAVTLRFGDGGMFGSGYEQYEQFTLIDLDGFWYITQDPWPYFTWSCDQA